jgi:hypothetical protein
MYLERGQEWASSGAISRSRNPFIYQTSSRTSAGPLTDYGRGHRAGPGSVTLSLRTLTY